MSSWFTELAGKAENILNKIDQNAATVLKNENSNERDQLLEIKCNGDVSNGSPTDTKSNVAQITASIKRNYSSNSLKLSRTQKKVQSVSPDRKSHSEFATPSIQNESKHQNGAINDDDLLSVSTTMQSNVSNHGSRRSSCSSRTEGVQTVIEYPIEKTESTAKSGNIMTLSTSSTPLQNAADDKSELIATKIVLAQVKCERDKLKADVADLQTQLASVEQSDLIAEVTAACDKLTTDNEQLLQKFEEIQQMNSTLIKTVSDLETTVAQLHQSEMDLREKLQWTKTESEQAVFELQQYRSRAQHTLQMKDDIIAELRAAKNGNVENDMETDSQCKQHEWLTMSKERDTFLEEIKMLRNQLDASKQFIKSLETKYHDTESRYSDNEKSLTNTLKQEKLRCNQLDDMVRTQSHELNAVRAELKRQQISASTQLLEKENELKKLRTKLAQPAAVSGSMPTNNADDRIYSLTQSLVQKQNSLEMVTAERNAIRIQLEKLENQHRETIQMLRQQNRLPQIININDTDDAKSQVPNFMQENPFDTRVARRMKRAYSSLDAAGIRLGVFMRRYPLIRTLAIVYVALLHLWVMFVLLSSTPN